MKETIRKISKKILTLLFCISIVTAIMPVKVYAADTILVINKTPIDLATMNSLLGEDYYVYRVRTKNDFYGHHEYAYIGGDDNAIFTPPAFGESYRVEFGDEGHATTKYLWKDSANIIFKQGYEVNVKIEGLADTENVYVDINGEQCGSGSKKQVIVGDEYTITPQTIEQHDYTVSVTKVKYNGSVFAEETLVSGGKNQPITWEADKENSVYFPYTIKVVYTDNRIQTTLEASETPLTLSGSDDANILNSLSQKVKLKSGSSEITGKNIYFKTAEGNELTSDFMLEKADGDEFTVKAYFDGDDTYQPASAEIPVKVTAAFQVNDIEKDFTGNPITVALSETGRSSGEVLYYNGNKQPSGAPTNPGDYYYRVKDGNVYSNYGRLRIKEIAATVTDPTIREDLIYNGTEQELFINGSSEHGIWLYTNAAPFGTPIFISQDFPKAKDAETYTWWYQFFGNPGYSDIGPFKINVTISPKPITVDLESSNITKTYDGTVILENATVALKGIVPGDDVQATATITYDNKNAGTGKTITASNIVLSGASAKNYTLEAETATGTGEIVPRDIILTPYSASKTYGNPDPEFTYTHTQLAEGDTLEDIILTRNEGETAGKYTITASQPQGANPNYNITFLTNEFTINKREIIVEWGETELKYTGQKVFPKATITNLVEGDECGFEIVSNYVLTGGMECIDVGKWIAEIKNLTNSNYKLPDLLENRTTFYNIINADQEKPVLTSTNETIDNKKDGTISGLTAAMEYRKSSEESYTAITDAMLSNGTMNNLSAGTYYVRYTAKANYNASADTEVIISSGDKLIVSIPENQDGYTLTVDNAEVLWNGTATLIFELKGGYSKTENFAIKVNDQTVELNEDGEYTISAIQQNQIVTVEGVADITSPNATIEVKENRWYQFLNKITFKLFFKETQKVTITADDFDGGSGFDKLYYFLSAEEIEEEKIESVAEWTEYNDPFNINPDNEYIIYAKAVDKAGNIKYISSEIIVLDSVVPIIEGVEDGETYYTTQKVTVTDKNIGTVTLNDNPADENITLDGNTEVTYTIVATDSAGNETTVTVTMKPISELSAPIDTLTKDNVNSSNESVIDSVKAAVAAVDTTNATDEEKAALKEITNKADELQKKIDDTKAETNRINEEINKFDIDTVNSDDLEALEQISKDIKVLTDADNLTDDERAALAANESNIAAMQKTIADTVAENDRISDAVDGYDLATVTSDDKADLEQLLADIEKQLESTHLTDEEISELNVNKKAVEDLLTKIKSIDELIDKLTEDVDGYSDDTVKSTDKDVLEQIIKDIDALTQTENLTDAEKQVLEDAKEKAKGLLNAIEDAAKATNTENTEKVKDVTTENVTPKDKTDLQKAKEDLEKALEDYKDNLTADEKKAIEDEINRIDETLEMIGNVEVAEGLINKLPNTIKKDDEAAVKAADDAYNALTDYEKSLVDKDAKKALDDAKAALAELNKPADPNSPLTGDNNNMLLWIALLFISGGLSVTLTVVGRKKKTAVNK